jgi:hypothetical protein
MMVVVVVVMMMMVVVAMRVRHRDNAVIAVMVVVMMVVVRVILRDLFSAWRSCRGYARVIHLQRIQCIGNWLQEVAIWLAACFA